MISLLREKLLASWGISDAMRTTTHTDSNSSNEGWWWWWRSVGVAPLYCSTDNIASKCHRESEQNGFLFKWGRNLVLIRALRLMSWQWMIIQDSLLFGSPRCADIIECVAEIAVHQQPGLYHSLNFILEWRRDTECLFAAFCSLSL